MDLLVTVKEVKGDCPVYKAGESFTIEDGFKLVSERPVCMHALSAIMPIYNALRFTGPASLGLAGKDEKTKTYVQCPDPVCYTGGGTAIFEITRKDDATLDK